VLSGYWLHATGDLMPVESEVLLGDWKALRARYPRQFAATTPGD
jgi:hypothetical protein